MNVEVPGGQQVFVAPDGSVGYTAAHSHAIPDGGITAGFAYTPPAEPNTVGELTGPAGFVACPTGDAGVFQVKTAIDGADTAGCTGFAAGATPFDGVGAWQYI